MVKAVGRGMPVAPTAVSGLYSYGDLVHIPLEDSLEDINCIFLSFFQQHSENGFYFTTKLQKFINRIVVVFSYWTSNSSIVVIIKHSYKIILALSHIHHQNESFNYLLFWSIGLFSGTL